MATHEFFEYEKEIGEILAISMRFLDESTISNERTTGLIWNNRRFAGFVVM